MTTTPAQPNQPPLLQDRYRITARLGQNRLALVFQAVDERLSRPVLVHVLRPELEDNEQLRQRFIDEGQGLARCTHPALLDMYDRGEVGKRLFMVTEFVSGQTLRAALPLPLNQAVRVLRQIVGAVAVANASQAVVPPIAAETILLGEDGRPMLADPWWLTPDELRIAVSKYRAPERADGGPPSERAVVYSLGLLGYELILGKQRWSAAQAQHGEKLPSLYEELPGFLPSLAAALAMATAREPHARTLDVPAFSRDLAAVESAVDTPTKPLVRPVPAFRETMREVRKTITQRRQQASNIPPPNQRPSAQAVAPAQQAAPRPVMPPPPQRMAPPPQSMMPAQQQAAPPSSITRDDLRKELRKEIRREARRRGCLSFFTRKIVLLIFLGVLVGGCWIGYAKGKEWFNGLDIRGWLCQNTPQMVCSWLPETGPLAEKPIPKNFRVITDGRVRSGPSTNTKEIVMLPAGHIVNAPDSRGTRVGDDGFTWIEIKTEFEGRSINGWMSMTLLEETQ